MPENELQRQQLMRLLTSQGASGTDTMNSATTTGEATYKIHWPAAHSSHQGTRRTTMTSLRHVPFTNNGRRSSTTQSPGFPPSQTYHHLNNNPAALPELPNIIVEEPTMSNGYPSTHHTLPPPQGHPSHYPDLSQPQSIGTATPLRPNIYNPLLPAFFEHHPGERVPSYHPRAVSQYQYLPTPTSTQPPPLPHPLPALNHNGYPLEKRTPKDDNTSQPFAQLKGQRPPLDNYVVVDADREARARTMGAVRGGQGGQTRAEIELAEHATPLDGGGGGELGGWKRW